MKDKKRGDIIALVMTICGLVMYWCGMFYALGAQDVVHLTGIAIAFLGLALVVAAYPTSLALGGNYE